MKWKWISSLFAIGLFLTITQAGYAQAALGTYCTFGAAGGGAESVGGRD